MDAIIYIQCCVCRAEAPAWFDEEDKPDIPPSWRAMAAGCCPQTEYYACSGRCAMQCGNRLIQNHKSNEILVREIEAEMDDDQIMEMLSECDEVCDIPEARGGPGFNTWELEFLESLRDQMAGNRQLTAKQIEKLQELWDRI
jgi:hypothetical protein